MKIVAPWSFALYLLISNVAQAEEAFPPVVDRYMEDIRSVAMSQLSDRLSVLQSMSSCLSSPRTARCKIEIRFRHSSPEYISMTTDKGGITSSSLSLQDQNSVLKFIREQIVQYRMNTILASAETIFKDNEYTMSSQNGPPQNLLLQADAGLLPIVVPHNGSEMRVAVRLMRFDLRSIDVFFSTWMSFSPFPPDERSYRYFAEVRKAATPCKDQRECPPLHPVQESMITPFYRTSARNLAEQFPYLQTLASRPANEAHPNRVKRALENSIVELQSAIESIKNLRGKDRILLLTLLVPGETVLYSKTDQERQTIQKALERLRDERSFWSELKEMSLKPSFLALVGCYGTAALTAWTPLVTVLPIACHALGLGVATTNISNSWDQMSRTLNLLKLQQINADTHHSASLDLVMEVGFSLLYAQAVLPSFYPAYGIGVGAAGFSGGFQQDARSKERMGKLAADQFIENLQKLGLIKAASFFSRNEHLDFSFIKYAEIVFNVMPNGRRIQGIEWLPYYQMQLTLLANRHFFEMITMFNNNPSEKVKALQRALLENFQGLLETTRAESKGIVESLAQLP